MREPALFGELHLPLAFTKAHAVGVGVLLHAAMTGDAFLEFGARAVRGRKWPAAGTAKRERQHAQNMAHRHTFVEDETPAAPEAVLPRHLLEVFQDAAAQVIDLLDPLRLEVGRRFLAPDATGAEHRDALVVEAVAIGLPPSGEIAEAFGVRIDGALERADRRLVVVAGV